jgi:hypothetical protein
MTAAHAPAAEALAAEALRVNARYLDEVVVGWGLCPFAERALSAGEVERRVLLDDPPEPARVVAAVAELGAIDTATIGLLIFPRARLSSAAFDALAESVRRDLRSRAFLVAAFHPLASSSFSTAPQLVSFLRRTPDPTLQLVRAQVMERLPPGVSAEVGRQNFATVSARDPARLDALLRDIRRDRDESYARLAA